MPQPEWLKPFPAAFRKTVTALLRLRAERRIACFDADGTLWTEDIGESWNLANVLGRKGSAWIYDNDVWSLKNAYWPAAKAYIEKRYPGAIILNEHTVDEVIIMVESLPKRAATGGAR